MPMESSPKNSKQLYLLIKCFKYFSCWMLFIRLCFSKWI